MPLLMAKPWDPEGRWGQVWGWGPKEGIFSFSTFSSIKSQLVSAWDFPLSVRVAPHLPSLMPSIPIPALNSGPHNFAPGGHPQPLQWEQGSTSPHLCHQDFPPSSNPTSIIFKNNLFLELHFTVSARLQSVQRFPKYKQMPFHLMDQKNLTPYVPLYFASAYFVFFICGTIELNCISHPKLCIFKSQLSSIPQWLQLESEPLKKLIKAK